MSRPRVVVIGSGLQGCSAALGLANAGFAVDILEQDARAYNRTSLRAEGKIHLGFIYAKDRSEDTLRLMLRGALRFSGAIDALVRSPVDWRAMRSTPFRYLLLNETMVEPEALYAHYDRVECHYRAAMEDRELSYLGARPERIWERAEPDAWLAAGRAAAVVRTQEVAVDSAALRRIVLAAVRDHPEISLHCNARVEAVERAGDGFALACKGGERRAAAVVNCTWHDRMRIDAGLLAEPPEPGTFRLKYSVLVRRPGDLQALPSCSMVLGPFGDVVTRPGTDETYLSWYPACLQGFEVGTSPPASWDSLCAEAQNGRGAEEIRQATLRAFNGFMPGMDAARTLSVQAGVIVAAGSSDITDPDSGLHRRDALGIEGGEGYFSVNPGKLTMAPSLALDLVERVKLDLG